MHWYVYIYVYTQVKFVYRIYEYVIMIYVHMYVSVCVYADRYILLHIFLLYIIVTSYLIYNKIDSAVL